MTALPRSIVHLFGNVAPMLTGLVTAPLTARALGVADRATVAIFLLAGGLISVVAAVGLGWAARADVARDHSAAVAWVAVSQRIGWVFLPIFAIAGGLIAALDELSTSVIVAVAISFGFSSMSAGRSVTANVLISLGDIRSVGTANLAMAATTVASTVLLFVTGQLSIPTALLASSLGLLAQWVWLGIGWRARLARLPKLSSGLSLRTALRRGSSAWLSQVVDALSSRSDSLVVLAASNRDAYGYYSVVAIVPQLCGQVFATMVQRSFAVNPRLPIGIRTISSLIVGGVVALLMTGFAVIAAYGLIPPLFGSEFSPAREFLPAVAVFSFSLGLLAPVLTDGAQRKSVARHVGIAYLVGVAVASASSFRFGPSVGVVVLGSITALGCVTYGACIFLKGSRISPRDAYRAVVVGGSKS